MIGRIDELVFARTGKRLGLRPGATSDELAEAERRTGPRLPDEVRRLYGTWNGAASSGGWLGAAGPWLSLDELVARWQAEQEFVAAR